MKKKILLIVIVCLVITIKGTCQQFYDIDKGIQVSVVNLRSAGVDTIGIYENYCTACITKFNLGKGCKYEGPFRTVQLTWKFNGETFVKVINSCGEFTTVKCNGYNFFQYYFDNAATIQTEQVKGEVTVNHYYIYQLKIFTPQDSFSTKLAEPYFWPSDEFAGSKYAAFNNNLRLKKWLDIVQKNQLPKKAYKKDKLKTKSGT